MTRMGSQMSRPGALSTNQPRTVDHPARIQELGPKRALALSQHGRQSPGKYDVLHTPSKRRKQGPERDGANRAERSGATTTPPFRYKEHHRHDAGRHHAVGLRPSRQPKQQSTECQESPGGVTRPGEDHNPYRGCKECGQPGHPRTAGHPTTESPLSRATASPTSFRPRLQRFR